MQAALRANHLDDKLYYTSPAGYISLVINLGVYLGIVLAMPWVLYQVWLFVAPGLYKHERRAAAGFIVSSMFLFLCGIAFAYFVLLPQMLNFLIGFANDGPIKPLISINEYFSLILIVLIGLGVIFELPVLIFILVAFRDRHAEIPAEEFPLRHAAHHRGGGDHYAHAGRDHHADLHGADDRAVFCRRAGIVCGAAQEAGAGHWRKEERH